MHGGMGASTYAYVALAAGLGLFMGLGMAVAMGRGKAPVVPQRSAAPTTPRMNATVSSSAKPIVPLAPVARVQDHRQAQSVARPISAKPTQAVNTKADRRKPRRLSKLLDWKMPRRHKRIPYVSPKPASVTEEPTALELATRAAAAGPVVLSIQGDVTVVGYDAATATVETYVGETYVLAGPSSEGGGIAWQNYPFTAHYSCDSAGNCMLNHAGASAIARLAR